jgi:hypothetical protein
MRSMVGGGRRRRRFESGPVLLIFDNSAHATSAHDVAAACCLAMAEVRVRLPLGVLDSQGVGKPGTGAWL